MGVNNMIIYDKAKVMEALENGVMKWANIYTGHGSKEQKTCPLCDLFLFLNDCQLCPVMSKTGLPRCKGTPYNDWAEHHKNEHGINLSTGMIVECKNCTKYAKRHFEFLADILQEAQNEDS